MIKVRDESGGWKDSDGQEKFVDEAGLWRPAFIQMV